MRVLFNTFPMAFHTPGGGEIQLLAYRKHLPMHGVDVELFNQWDPQFRAHDIVHFFSCIGGSVHFCHFVKQLGLPLVVSSSLWMTAETRHLYPADEIRAQFKLADRVVTNSNIESDTLATVLNLAREKFVTVYNGIDDFFLSAATPDLFRETFNITGRFVLNVGNIEPRKNQLALVRAMKHFPDVKLVLIGHQRNPEYAQSVFVEGGDQVVYLGPMEHGPMLLSAYRACALFCLPSTLETPGLAALEAAAQGCRLLLTSEGSCQEYFGNRAQYCDPVSPTDLERSLSYFLSKRESPDMEGESAFDANQWTWKQTTVALRDTYLELIQ